MKENMKELNLEVIGDVNGGYDGPVYQTKEGYFYATEDGPRYKTEAALREAIDLAKWQDEYYEEEYRGGPNDLGGLFISKTKKRPPYQRPW